MSLNKGIIPEDGFLFYVFLPIENFDIFWLWINFNISFSLFKFSGVFNWESTFLNLSSNSCSSVKGWDTSSSWPDFLCKSSLRGDFELKFSFQILSFELSIFSNVRWNHSFDLVISQKDSKTPIVDWIFVSIAAVVRNDGQIFDTEFFNPLDEVHWDTADTETSNKNFGSILNSLESLMNGWDDFADFREKKEVPGNISNKHLCVRCRKFMW